MNKKQKRLGNKGFSLVELIVVIAIMAVLVAVLAPTLVGKIEESRESSDLSTVTEIKTQVTNMLSNEKIYNQLVPAKTATGNTYNEYTISKTLVIAPAASDAQTEIQNVLENYEFQSKSAKDKTGVTVRINEKGKVYVFVADSTGAVVKAGEKDLKSGNEITGTKAN